MPGFPVILEDLVLLIKSRVFVRSLILGFGLSSVGLLGGCSSGDLESPATQEAIQQEEQEQMRLSTEANDAAAAAAQGR